MIDPERLSIRSITYRYEKIEVTISQLFDCYYVSLYDAESTKHMYEPIKSDLEPGYLALSILEEYLTNNNIE